MVAPYWTDGAVSLYLGDMREVLPALGLTFDLCIADPPYASTRFRWDRWPEHWPNTVAAVTRSMWCFGTLRMFLDRRADFLGAGWRLSDDVIWRKPEPTSQRTDRFRRVHEQIAFWYRGSWDTIHRAPVKVPAATHHRTRVVESSTEIAPWNGHRRRRSWQDDGTRYALSVIDSVNMRGRRTTGAKTEKPPRVLVPLLEYACPPGGLVLDPFAGSGSTGEACRLTGRRAVLIEADEQLCADIAARLAQPMLEV